MTISKTLLNDDKNRETGSYNSYEFDYLSNNNSRSLDTIKEILTSSTNERSENYVSSINKPLFEGCEFQCNDSNRIPVFVAKNVNFEEFEKKVEIKNLEETEVSFVPNNPRSEFEQKTIKENYFSALKDYLDEKHVKKNTYDFETESLYDACTDRRPDEFSSLLSAESNESDCLISDIYNSSDTSPDSVRFHPNQLYSTSSYVPFNEYNFMSNDFSTFNGNNFEGSTKLWNDQNYSILSAYPTSTSLRDLQDFENEPSFNPPENKQKIVATEIATQPNGCQLLIKGEFSNVDFSNCFHSSKSSQNNIDDNVLDPVSPKSEIYLQALNDSNSNLYFPFHECGMFDNCHELKDNTTQSFQTHYSEPNNLIYNDKADIYNYHNYQTSLDDTTNHDWYNEQYSIPFHETSNNNLLSREGVVSSFQTHEINSKIKPMKLGSIRRSNRASVCSIISKKGIVYNLDLISIQIKKKNLFRDYDIRGINCHWYEGYNRSVGDIGRKLILKEIREWHSRQPTLTEQKLNRWGLSYGNVRYMTVEKLFQYSFALGSFEYAVKVSLEYGGNSSNSNKNFRKRKTSFIDDSYIDDRRFLAPKMVENGSKYSMSINNSVSLPHDQTNFYDAGLQVFGFPKTEPSSFDCKTTNDVVLCQSQFFGVDEKLSENITKQSNGSKNNLCYDISCYPEVNFENGVGNNLAEQNSLLIGEQDHHSDPLSDGVEMDNKRFVNCYNIAGCEKIYSDSSTYKENELFFGGSSTNECSTNECSINPDLSNGKFFPSYKNNINLFPKEPSESNNFVVLNRGICPGNEMNLNGFFKFNCLEFSDPNVNSFQKGLESTNDVSRYEHDNSEQSYFGKYNVKVPPETHSFNNYINALAPHKYFHDQSKKGYFSFSHVNLPKEPNCVSNNLIQTTSDIDVLQDKYLKNNSFSDCRMRNTDYQTPKKLSDAFCYENNGFSKNKSFCSTNGRFYGKTNINTGCSVSLENNENVFHNNYNTGFSNSGNYNASSEKRNVNYTNEPFQGTVNIINNYNTTVSNNVTNNNFLLSNNFINHTNVQNIFLHIPTFSKSNGDSYSNSNFENLPITCCEEGFVYDTRKCEKETQINFLPHESCYSDFYNNDPFFTKKSHFKNPTTKEFFSSHVLLADEPPKNFLNSVLNATHLNASHKHKLGQSVCTLDDLSLKDIKKKRLV